MAYTYDYAGDVATLTDSLASTPYTLTYAYDAADHLNSVQSTWNDGQHPNSMFSTPVYQAFGITSADIGTGVTLARTYNKRGFIANETDKQVTGGATVYSYALGYYANGNVDTANDFVTGNWTYTYDTLNRVTSGVASSKSCNGMTINWTYDEWANRESQSASGSTCSIVQTNYTFTGGANNRIDQFASNYDLAGNLELDAQNNAFTYDAEGRIATVTNATTKYIYDAEGRRVAKENSSTGAVIASYALSLGGDELAEMNGSGAWQHSNIFAMGRLFATYGAEASTQTTRFHINDWLGSRRVDLNPSGTVTFSCFNYPYGDGQSCAGTDADITEQHFTGKMRDAETGDDDFGARYYASNMGRFLTADEVRNDAHPGNPQSWNLYSYVHGNPMSLVDPNGEASYSAVAAAEAAEEQIEQQNEDMDEATQEYASRIGFLSLDQIAEDQHAALPDAPQSGHKSKPKSKNAQKAKFSPYAVAAEDNSQGTVVNGVRGREVVYGVFEVNSDGSLGYQTHKFTISLTEELVAGSHAGTGICDKNNCSEDGAFEDSQSVKQGTPYSVKRTWSINGSAVPVWNPNARAPAAYEILHLDYSKGFTMEYGNQ